MVIFEVVQFYIFAIYSNTSKYSDYVFKRRQLMEQIESKLDMGLDRSINAAIGWVKVYLQNEQKKTDFKPETDVDTISSSVCCVKAFTYTN